MRWFLQLALVGAVSGCGFLDDLFGENNGGNERPDGEYCEVVAEWDPAWQQVEAEILRLTNVERSRGADCGVEGVFAPAPALSTDDRLRCAARNHSWDMALEGYFDHVNLQGEEPKHRAEKAGYTWQAVGENIAAGQTTPERVVAAWMGSDEHCRNIMDAVFTELGVGYYYDSDDRLGHFWTQVFGRPR